MTSVGKALVGLKTISGDSVTGISVSGKGLDVEGELSSGFLIKSAYDTVTGDEDVTSGTKIINLFEPAGDAVSQWTLRSSSAQPFTFNVGSAPTKFGAYEITMINRSSSIVTMSVTGDGGYSPTLDGGAFPYAIPAQTTVIFYVAAAVWTIKAKSTNQP